MAITKLRLEAEGTTLDEVLKDVEAATRAARLPKSLQVHDEHYERVHDTLFRGRRVFGVGPAPRSPQNPAGHWHQLGGPQTFYGTAGTKANQMTVAVGPSVAIPLNPRKNDPQA